MLESPVFNPKTATYNEIVRMFHILINPCNYCKGDEYSYLQFTDRRELLDNLTISDWILPAVYQGHFTTVVWIKPPWSTQIPAGEHEIELGVDDAGLLKTSSILPYYLSDLSYSGTLHHKR